MEKKPDPAFGNIPNHIFLELSNNFLGYKYLNPGWKTSDPR
jgi:hypothetical protein